ncbi:hypothetical protein [Lysinibacillus sp. CTST325]
MKKTGSIIFEESNKIKDGCECPNTPVKKMAVSWAEREVANAGTFEELQIVSLPAIKNYFSSNR